MIEFDTSGPGQKGSLFGLPFTEKESLLQVIPVRWDVTTSFKDGTSKSPDNVLMESSQIDLFDEFYGDCWNKGIYFKPDPLVSVKGNDNLRLIAKTLIQKLEEDPFYKYNDIDLANLKLINDASGKLNAELKDLSLGLIKNGFIPVVLGGDHSVPFGLISAYKSIFPKMGILHIDAHADLRVAYEGFEYSHASIMYNCASKLKVEKIVQFGIRDFCEDEFEFAKSSNGVVKMFTDSWFCAQQYKGVIIEDIFNEIVNELPTEVYISFDVDGLNPSYCPNTGTPVPGGIDYNHAVYLIKKVVQSGRRVVGFDLNEVGCSADMWDENVGSRLLYQLSLSVLKSNKY